MDIDIQAIAFQTVNFFDHYVCSQKVSLETHLKGFR